MISFLRCAPACLLLIASASAGDLPPAAQEEGQVRTEGDFKEDFPACHQLTRKGIERLGKRLGVGFDIPFPKDRDIDFWDKQPIAKLAVEGGNLCITKPFVNPWDGEGTVTWMVATDPGSLSGKGFNFSLTLDEKGDFEGTNLFDDTQSDWVRGADSGAQMNRKDGEPGQAFFHRAMGIYLKRAAGAPDPALAKRAVAAIEKVALAVQALRIEEGALAASVKDADHSQGPMPEKPEKKEAPDTKGQ